MLAQTVTEEGRAIVVALNKMDTVAQDAWQPLLERVRESLQRQLPQVCADVGTTGNALMRAACSGLYAVTQT